MRPNDLAVVHPAGALSYVQLAAVVSAVALRLRASGVGPGVTAAIYVSDPVLHLALMLAAMLNGTASISAHPNYETIPPSANIEAFLADRALPFSASAPVIPVEADWMRVDEANATRPMLVGDGFAGDHSICRVYTSSGTTGVPKVVAYSEASVYAVAVASVLMEPSIAGPNLSMMWFSTIGGFGTTQVTLWHGCTLVLAPTPATVLRALNLYRVAFLRASPQQLQALVEMVRGRVVRFPSLERIEVGGASTPAAVLNAARAIFCPNVMGLYGATETGVATQAPAALLHAQPDAAGYVVPGASVRIVDDAGQPVAAGVQGIVQVRTPWMAREYVGDAQATAAAFSDGWFIPGDLGVLNTEGLLYLRGRVDELINSGGVKLNPVSVDEFLLTQSGVRDAAAFAFRQSGRNDEIWAAVVGGEDLNDDALLAACRARLNSSAPARLVRMSEIPRNAMGKPLRQLLSQNAKLN
jgi:acyl-coenzyme A synthetase/AMP-(fatty) acid ligase